MLCAFTGRTIIVNEVDPYLFPSFSCVACTMTTSTIPENVMKWLLLSLRHSIPFSDCLLGPVPPASTHLYTRSGRLLLAESIYNTAHPFCVAAGWQLRFHSITTTLRNWTVYRSCASTLGRWVLRSCLQSARMHTYIYFVTSHRVLCCQIHSTHYSTHQALTVDKSISCVSNCAPAH